MKTFASANYKKNYVAITDNICVQDQLKGAVAMIILAYCEVQSIDQRIGLSFFTDLQTQAFVSDLLGNVSFVAQWCGVHLYFSFHGLN